MERVTPSGPINGYMATAERDGDLTGKPMPYDLTPEKDAELQARQDAFIARLRGRASAA